MRSAFLEFNTPISGLFTARAALDTVSHNIANAETKGYSRQYVEQRTNTPLRSVGGKGMIGSGSEVYGINQYRNTFLDKKYWSEKSVLGEYTSKNTQLTIAEKTMSELSETGLTAQIDNFFDLLQDLTTNAGDATYRTNVIQLGNSMTTFVKNSYESLRAQQKDINEEVKTTVDIINSYASQIGSLNGQILLYELDGTKANDMRDQRAELVDKLSLLVNVKATETEKNKDYAMGKYPDPEDRRKSIKEFSLQINGLDLVKGTDVLFLECKERKAEQTPPQPSVSLRQNIEDADGLYDVFFRVSGAKLNIYHPNLKGELKGLIEVRDGNNGSFFLQENLATKNPVLTGNILTFKADELNNKRLDLSESGGFVKLFDKTGTIREFKYKSFAVDKTTGDVSIEFVNSSENVPPSNLEVLNAKSISVGETSTYKGIPYYMSRYNDLVRTFAKAINEGKYMDNSNITNVNGHVNSFDASGKNLKTLFFTHKNLTTGQEAVFGKDYDINKMTADNFIINSDLIKKPNLLATSLTSSSGVSDNNAVLQFINIKTDNSLFLEGTIPQFINGLASELAIDLSQANNFEKNYTDVTNSIQNQRLSFSGVDINEEMVNMVKYQQSYKACAKLINTIDSIYDTTINRLGV